MTYIVLFFFLEKDKLTKQDQFKNRNSEHTEHQLHCQALNLTEYPASTMASNINTKKQIV